MTSRVLSVYGRVASSVLVSWLWLGATMMLLAGRGVDAQATSPDSLRTLISRLSSDSVGLRAAALRQLTTQQSAARSTEVRSALVALLERENLQLASTQGRGTSQLGAGFGEYYSEILSYVVANADLRDSRTIRAVAVGAYNPDSPLAKRLAASAGARVLPVATEMFASPNGSLRVNGLALVGHVYRQRDVHRLDVETQRRLMRMITAAAEDSWAGLRLEAVVLLTHVGTPAELPLLTRIAATDPYSRPHESLGQDYPVRQAARAAVLTIQRRHRE